MAHISNTKVLGVDLDVIIMSIMALLIAEVTAIYLISHGFGTMLANFLASLSTKSFQTMIHLYQWADKMVGKVLVPLLLLTFAEAWAVYKLVQNRKSANDKNVFKNQFKVLEIVEGAAPGFGFIGTCLALIGTMHNMDPKLDQQAMLKILLENSSSAFGSTVFGISLALTAFLFKEIFKGFLIKTPPANKRDNNVTEIPEGKPIIFIREGA